MKSTMLEKLRQYYLISVYQTAIHTHLLCGKNVFSEIQSKKAYLRSFCFISLSYARLYSVLESICFKFIN